MILLVLKMNGFTYRRAGVRRCGADVKGHSSYEGNVTAGREAG